MLSVYFPSNTSQFYYFLCIWMDFDDKCRKTSSATQTASFLILENFVSILEQKRAIPVVNTHFFPGQKLFHSRSQHSFLSWSKIVPSP